MTAELKEKEEFQKKITESTKPVLVDFYAVWCGPCRAYEPTMEEIEKEYRDTVDVIKIDVDKFPEIANVYNVVSVPTLMLFRGGESVSRLTGMRPKDEITAMLGE